MSRDVKAIEIGNSPDLLRLVEEVREADEPRVLRRNGEDLAILMPTGRRRRRAVRPKSKADVEAFHSAAGSWRDVDVDRFLSDTYESRRRSSRPPADL